MKIKQAHWHHFFGGVALLLLIIQILSGSVLTMFYDPHLNEAYASVQKIYNELSVVAWIRDTHRWAALFLMVAVIMHFIRSFLRKDYLNRDSKTLWLTGILLYLPMLGFLFTGVILPWEWRGYWFMEMVPNYVYELPLIGPSLSDFLISAFTLNRTLVMHVCILPAVTLVLMGIHTFTRVMKRTGGLTLYVLEHTPLTLPFLLAIAVLAYALPMPSQDPAIIPMPLDGENIPTAEWFILIFYVPYLYFKGFMATLFAFYIPVIIFLVLAIFPYFTRRRRGKSGRNIEQETHPIERSGAFTKIMAPFQKALGARAYAKTLAFLTVFLVSMVLFGPLYAVSHKSPTYGCNSCHNITAGLRLGLPPATFKDRVMNPNLKDNTFMVGHWFYPQVIW
ncbi:MAG: cytochrome b N-terminal domain-containing protein [Betaproteobacteria bacterium]|nr:cytochrome b N-terminal domain-containing protein [Betaproteobacteria bacterium]